MIIFVPTGTLGFRTNVAVMIRNDLAHDRQTQVRCPLFVSKNMGGTGCPGTPREIPARYRRFQLLRRSLLRIAAGSKVQDFFIRIFRHCLQSIIKQIDKHAFHLFRIKSEFGYSRDPSPFEC